MYHVRFLLFASYADVQEKSVIVKLFYFVTGLGQEALTIYIVLSGMVLGGLSSRRWRLLSVDPMKDLRRRSLRFYAIFFPALVVGGLLDLAGGRVFGASGVYTTFPLFSSNHLTIESFLGNLLMLQGFLVPSFGSNGILFILAYEAWAYLIFTVFCLLRRRHKYLALLPAAASVVVAIVLSPNFFGYFMIWLIGLRAVALARTCRFLTRPRLAVVIFASTLLFSRITNAAVGRSSWVESLALIATQVLMGLAFSMMLLSLAQNEASLTGGRILPPRWSYGMARTSLALYVSHFPVMMILVAAGNVLLLTPIATQPHLANYLYFFAILFVIYAFALLLGWVTKYFDRLMVRRVSR
jgi:peptidoglycan/LPS O-acetylase OafA/YrhL